MHADFSPVTQIRNADEPEERMDLNQKTARLKHLISVYSSFLSVPLSNSLLYTAGLDSGSWLYSSNHPEDLTGDLSLPVPTVLREK